VNPVKESFLRAVSILSKLHLWYLFKSVAYATLSMAFCISAIYLSFVSEAKHKTCNQKLHRQCHLARYCKAYFLLSVTFWHGPHGSFPNLTRHSELRVAKLVKGFLGRRPRNSCERTTLFFLSSSKWNFRNMTLEMTTNSFPLVYRVRFFPTR